MREYMNVQMRYIRIMAIRLEATHVEIAETYGRRFRDMYYTKHDFIPGGSR